MTEPRDGRRARGERKRAAIIAATLRVVERDGVAGVSHRAVAREAGVAGSAAIYYFATLDDLLVAALTAAAEDYARQLREIIEGGGDGVDGLAQLITEAGGSGRSRALAEQELTLLAARRPALRAVATHWRDMVADVARGYTSDPVAVEATVAAADGLCARMLLGAESLTAAQVSALLRHALRLT
ncbi:TetR/AcrR family transcriptional regulator [Amycolatopsis cihanbeyliensis]|uniref:TetR family transcriptional regulator n=1 Tax=Amycolatopsis cihanbeyliensis TaxID=1128664 RepID=A0A542DMK8_AMYCI|nr:TetR family transcriptional regulator [Amycolatopsis cihanbeyliensis]TQJ04328.1 TetR family transcriptional regulator [Amycolatopsis cihanbeyliensis]